MIRSFEVRLNAAHPELPLFEATAIVGSASTAFIRRVPASVGSWHITKVYVNAQYPDNTNVTIEAKVGAEGIWTATLPATETSGRVKSGFTILADGIDENGDPITHYILGIADFAVYTRDLKVQPGAKSWVLKYFDVVPDPAKKGDVAKIDDVIKLYDGTEWVAFGSEVDLSDYYTKEETDEAIDRLAAYYITYTAAGAAFPTRAALLSASTYYSGGVARTPTRNDYAVVLADETHDGAEYRYIYAVADGETVGQWEAQYPIETNDYTALSNKPTINNVEVSGNKTGANLGLVDVAGGTMTGALAVPTIYLTQNATQEPMIRTRLANGAIQISWDNGQTYHNLYLPYVNSNVNMTTLEQVYNFVGKVAPAWSESATYAVGDIVSFMGAYYVCRMAGSTGIPATDISHWKAEKLSNLLAAVTIPVRQPPYLADEYFPITCERNSAEVTYTQSDVRIVTNTQVRTYELRTADSANLAIAYFGSSGTFNTEGSGVSNLMFAGQSPYSVTVTLTLTPTGGTVVRSAELEDALGKKQNTLTFDDTPTAGSNNPVKSGGIKTALDGKFDKTGGTITGTITLTNVSANTVEVASTPIAGGSTPGVDFIDPATDHTATLIIGSGGMVPLRRGATSVGGIPQFDAEGGIVNSGKTVGDLERYALGETITASATLADRTMNKVEPLATNTTDIELSFPAATNGKARDFLVLINNPTGNTGTITFDPPAGAMIYGDGLTQTFAAGETWEVTITEVATKQFLCKALKVEGVQVPYVTQFEVTTSGNYMTAGIYSATAIDSTIPTVVKWGDGNTDSVTGDISQLTHTYSAEGTYVVTISDNISSLSITGVGSWGYSTTQNTYVITKVITLSPSISSIPTDGLGYLGNLNELNAGEAGLLTLATKAVETTGYTSPTGIKMDFSGRTITDIPKQCFSWDVRITEFKWPKGLTTIGEEAFRSAFDGQMALDTLVIPEGVTTLGSGIFALQDRIKSLTFPASLTSFGYIGLTYLESLICRGTTAAYAPSYAFGNGFNYYYTGESVMSAGNNRLYVPAGATGYDSGAWLDPLQNSTKCGFTKVEV